MEIIISRGICVNNIAHKWETVTKSYDSDIVPRVGDRVDSSAFDSGEEVKVVEVVFNYEQNYVYVYLEALHFLSVDVNEVDDVIERNVNVYKMHGWN